MLNVSIKNNKEKGSRIKDIFYDFHQIIHISNL